MHKWMPGVRRVRFLASCRLFQVLLYAQAHNHSSPWDPMITVPGPSWPLVGYAALVSSAGTGAEATVIQVCSPHMAFVTFERHHNGNMLSKLENGSSRLAVTPTALCFGIHLAPPTCGTSGHLPHVTLPAYFPLFPSALQFSGLLQDSPGMSHWRRSPHPHTRPGRVCLWSVRVERSCGKHMLPHPATPFPWAAVGADGS